MGVAPPHNGGMPPRLRRLLAHPSLGGLADQPVLCRLLMADFLVLLAELGLAVVMPWWVHACGGASALAIFGVALALAGFVIAPAVSPFGDRLCKSRQIRRGLAGLCVLTWGLAALSWAGVFSLAVLFGLAIAQAAAASIVDPARDAVLAELVPPAQLPQALRLRKTAHALGGMFGPLLAGGALGVGGVTGALCVCAALLMAALLAAWQLPGTAVPEKPRGAAQWWRDLRAGLAAKWRVPMERGWTLVNFVVWIFQGPAVGMLIPIKVQALGLPGPWLGFGLGAMSLGVLLGSLFGSQWLVQRFGRYRVRLGLGGLEGLALAAVGWAGSPALLLAGLTAAGFCNAAMSLVGATHRALAVPRDYRIRLSAAGAMTTRIAGAIGPALVGLALARFSVAAVYVAWGLLMTVSVLGFLAVPRLKEFLSLGHDDIVDWYRVQYPGVFR